MNTRLQERLDKLEKGSSLSQKVVVAVKASKEISKAAILWALTHVVQSGDCITFLVLVGPRRSGGKLWGFPRFSGDCANSNRRPQLASGLDQNCDIMDSCSKMMLKLHDVYDPDKINVRIKILSGLPCGAVATESKKLEANWVVLDKQMKQEQRCCMAQLQCNIVVMKRSRPKVLRLNLVGSPKTDSEECLSRPILEDSSKKHKENCNKSMASTRGSFVTPSSSPELHNSFTTTDAGTSSVSSSEPNTSPFLISERTESIKEEPGLDASNTDPDGASHSPTCLDPGSAETLNVYYQLHDRRQISKTEAIMEKFARFDFKSNPDFNRNLREAISLTRNSPVCPPPLCSICQHKAPTFGKPPRWFSYKELELATGGFSQANFLAEGGFGSVHRGVLPDGQVVAVKQHKLASTQGDNEFCSEVEVLSCAQHRNVVTLIGYCIEDGRRLLVYEYICNGSLDSYLYGRNRKPLEWSARQKIAVGAARGLRYLHEECRVGCIIHRDLRPNNILITHDFEPLVGDFGLARWQPNGNLGVETRVIGTFGYLAPEYAQSGQITEKADVYSFGVVLVELVTGRKAVDINRPKGQQCLTEWARPLLEEYAIEELVDPYLGKNYGEYEVYCMLHAASLCTRRDPHLRPRMSQVLRILEGDMVVEPNNVYHSKP